MTSSQVLLTIFTAIAIGAYDGIQRAKAEGVKVNLGWCARYCIGYFTVWLLAIATPIVLFAIINPYLN
jgi:hypothetical protein